jgi:hypothetical protein
MAPGHPREGKITLTYDNQKVQIQFENQVGEIVKTIWVNTGDFNRTKIRIWGDGQYRKPGTVH